MKPFLLLIGGFLTLSLAQSAPEGKLTVDGQPVKLTHVFAYSTEGFFDKKKDDTIVILADRAIADAQLRDDFALRSMAEQGKLIFIRETINSGGQIVNFLIGNKAFKALPSGGSTEHVFEGKIEGASIAGKVRTKGEQSFFGTKYEYEVSFKSAVRAKASR